MTEISMAQIASVLVVYGDTIAQHVRKILRKKHFFVRLSGFIALNAFLLGFVTIFLARFLASLYLRLPSMWLSPAIAGIFILIGVLAERHKHL